MQSCGGTDEEETERITDTIEKGGCRDNIAVEEIQDLVEKALVERGHAKVAKPYIMYRADRNKRREMNTALMKIYEDLIFKSAIDSDANRENANTDSGTAMGMCCNMAQVQSSLIVCTCCHRNTPQHMRTETFHIHDFDFYTLMMTCTQIDLTKLLKTDFRPIIVV